VIVGVLSDTHGRWERAAAAVALLQRLGAAAFVHCGDIGGARVLDALAGQRAWLVLGNTDLPEDGLGTYAQSLGLPAPASGPLRIELDGHTLIVAHGHEREFERLVVAHMGSAMPPGVPGAAFLLHGHTHVARAQRLASGAWLVNPGALYRVGVPTVATLDLADASVRFWVVPEPGAPDGPPRSFDPENAVAW